MSFIKKFRKAVIPKKQTFSEASINKAGHLQKLRQERIRAESYAKLKIMEREEKQRIAHARQTMHGPGGSTTQKVVKGLGQFANAAMQDQRRQPTRRTKPRSKSKKRKKKTTRRRAPRRQDPFDFGF